MAIDTFVQLTGTLANSYVCLLHASNSRYVLAQKDASKTSSQWAITDAASLASVATITVNSLHEPHIVLLNVVQDGRVDTVVVDWHTLWPQGVTFPVDEVNLLADLIQAFNARIGPEMHLDQLKELFEKDAQTHVLRIAPEAPLKVTFPRPLLSDETPAQRVIPDRPDFEDELELQRPYGGASASRNFPSIGDRDLNPPGLPKHPELKPYIDPLGLGEGGMHPTADHPIFGGRPQHGASSRLGVPPGARFDDPLSGEDNFEALGNGLPGNLRGVGGGGQSFPDFPGGGFGGQGPFI